MSKPITPEQARWNCAQFEKHPVAPIGGQCVFTCRIVHPDTGESVAPRYNYIDGEWVEVPRPNEL